MNCENLGMGARLGWGCQSKDYFICSLIILSILLKLTPDDGQGCQNHACKEAWRIGLTGSIGTLSCFYRVEEVAITLRDIDVAVIMPIPIQLIFFRAEKLLTLENSWYVIILVRLSQLWLWLIFKSFSLLLCQDCCHCQVVQFSLCMKILTIVDYCSTGVAETDGYKLISTYCALNSKRFQGILLLNVMSAIQKFLHCIQNSRAPWQNNVLNTVS
jgi:hypothetical protein